MSSITMTSVKLSKLSSSAVPHKDVEALLQGRGSSAKWRHGSNHFIRVASHSHNGNTRAAGLGDSLTRGIEAPSTEAWLPEENKLPE